MGMVHKLKHIFSERWLSESGVMLMNIQFFSTKVNQEQLCKILYPQIINNRLNLVYDELLCNCFVLYYYYYYCLRSHFNNVY